MGRRPAGVVQFAVMTVVIEDAEFDQAVRELAAATGEPEALALKLSVRERLDRVTLSKGTKTGTEETEKPTVEEIMKLIRSFDLGPVNYDLTQDEILGYGPNGYCE